MIFRSKKPKKLYVRYVSAISLLILIWVFYGGCCTKHAPVVVIQEKEYRSCLYTLPLTQTAQAELKAYLKKGGDYTKPNDTVGFYNDAFYTGLLTHLGKGDNGENGGSRFDIYSICGKDNTGWIVNVTASQWFKKRPVFAVYGISGLYYSQVSICAKAEELKISDINKPLSLYDGYFWWIFFRDYNDIKRLTHVIVTIPVEGSVPHSWEE